METQVILCWYERKPRGLYRDDKASKDRCMVAQCVQVYASSRSIQHFLNINPNSPNITADQELKIA
jgi:hypothetical protein